MNNKSKKDSSKSKDVCKNNCDDDCDEEKFCFHNVEIIDGLIDCLLSMHLLLSTAVPWWSAAGACRDKDDQDQNDKLQEFAQVKHEEEPESHSTSSFEANTS